MTTAEHLAAQATSSPEAQLPQTGSLENEAAALSGGPDPAWIAQLANAFYNDHPGQPVPSAEASQPSPSLSDADPHVSSNRASPMFDAPLSPSEASSAPFLVPNPSGGASQPSAPIYAYEALRPGAYSPQNPICRRRHRQGRLLHPRPFMHTSHLEPINLLQPASLTRHFGR